MQNTKPKQDNLKQPIKNHEENNADKKHIVFGVILILIATFIFAWQDSVTKTLVADYPAPFIVMFRSWMFFIASLVFLKFSKRGIVANIKTKRPFIQLSRGLLLVVQWICVGLALHYLPLAETTALYEAYPIFGTILAVLILKETVGWRSITGVIIGFIGILIIVRPGMGVLSVGAIYALIDAFTFAFYIILTRLVSRTDNSQTSFFYMSAIPALVLSLAAPYLWVDIAINDLWLFFVLGGCAITAHLCIIKALSYAPVSVLQPFNYFQLIWAIFVGVLIFGEFPDKFVLIGAGLIVMSGLFVLYRRQVRKPHITNQAGETK